MGIRSARLAQVVGLSQKPSRKPRLKTFDLWWVGETSGRVY